MSAAQLIQVIREADAHFANGNPGRALALVRDTRIALDAARDAALTREPAELPGHA